MALADLVAVPPLRRCSPSTRSPSPKRRKGILPCAPPPSYGIVEDTRGNAMADLNFINLTEAQLDAHIYRIMPEPFVLSLFQSGQNVLSQVGNWKDKFENFQLKLGGVIDGEAFTYGFKDDFVGQCWTSEYLSEAMWGIYASDPGQRFLRIRLTPRKLLTALVAAHPDMPQDRCFVGKVDYQTEKQLQAYLQNGHPLEVSARKFAQSLLLKRRAFIHESEVRLIYFGDAKDCDDRLYRYQVEPHGMVTQIMADPNRDRAGWKADRAMIAAATGFQGEIKRSKIYDPPEWDAPKYVSDVA